MTAGRRSQREDRDDVPRRTDRPTGSCARGRHPRPAPSGAAGARAGRGRPSVRRDHIQDIGGRGSDAPHRGGSPRCPAGRRHRPQPRAGGGCEGCGSAIRRFAGLRRPRRRLLPGARAPRLSGRVHAHRDSARARGGARRAEVLSRRAPGRSVLPQGDLGAVSRPAVHPYRRSETRAPPGLPQARSGVGLRRLLARAGRVDRRGRLRPDPGRGCEDRRRRPERGQ